MEKTILFRNADVVATMDDHMREIPGGGVFVRGNRIETAGSAEELPDTADEIIDVSGHVLTPGLINTHHHMFQSLTRALPAAQDSELFDWLNALFPVWRNITPDMVQAASRTAMAELMLTGCTTAADHAYIYFNGIRLDDSIAAAEEMGIRFHAVRGAMSRGKSQGGLPPDVVVEKDESAVLADMQTVIERHHDPRSDGMIKVAVGPTSPFTVSTDLMRESAALARSYGVGLHTHTAENSKDVAYSKACYGMTPTQYAEEMGWVGDDVWHAHCVHLDDSGVRLFARTGTGVAHCPCSNMRLASGLAPVSNMMRAGVKIGLGVDGSASNDSGDLLGEARQAMFSARVRDHDPAAMTARQALSLATRGGASVLGRDNHLGRLQEGYCADLVAFPLNDIAQAGSHSDPIASLVFCTPPRVTWSMIDGRMAIRDGRLMSADLGQIIHQHNRLSARLLDG